MLRSLMHGGQSVGLSPFKKAHLKIILVAEEL